MPKGQRFFAPIHVTLEGEELIFLLSCGHTTTRHYALYPHWHPGDVFFPVRRLMCDACTNTSRTAEEIP